MTRRLTRHRPHRRRLRQCPLLLPRRLRRLRRRRRRRGPHRQLRYDGRSGGRLRPAPGLGQLPSVHPGRVAAEQQPALQVERQPVGEVVAVAWLLRQCGGVPELSVYSRVLPSGWSTLVRASSLAAHPATLLAEDLPLVVAGVPGVRLAHAHHHQRARPGHRVQPRDIGPERVGDDVRLDAPAGARPQPPQQLAERDVVEAAVATGSSPGGADVVANKRARACTSVALQHGAHAGAGILGHVAVDNDGAGRVVEREVSYERSSTSWPGATEGCERCTTRGGRWRVAACRDALVNRARRHRNSCMRVVLAPRSVERDDAATSTRPSARAGHHDLAI